MSLTARICHHNGEPWMVIEAPPANAGGEPEVIYDGPLNLSNKRITRDEIDWVNTKTGVPRPDLYDAIRDYRRTAWQDSASHGESGLGQARQVFPAPAPSATQSVPHQTATHLRSQKGAMT